jgi:hypothetical protein
VFLVPFPSPVSSVVGGFPSDVSLSRLQCDANIWSCELGHVVMHSIGKGKDTFKEVVANKSI